MPFRDVFGDRRRIEVVNGDRLYMDVTKTGMPLQGGYPLDFYRDVDHKWHFDNGDPLNFFRGIQNISQVRPAPATFNGQLIDDDEEAYNQHVIFVNRVGLHHFLGSG